MTNMPYCRFRNTLADLQDCHEHLSDKCSAQEHDARDELIQTCVQIIEDLGASLSDYDVLEQGMRDLPYEKRESQA